MTLRRDMVQSCTHSAERARRPSAFAGGGGVSLRHDRVHDRGRALPEHLFRVAVPLSLVVGCSWRGRGQRSPKTEGGGPFRGGSGSAVVLPRRPWRSPISPWPWSRTSGSTRSLSREWPPPAPAGCPGCRDYPHQPLHDSWLHGRAGADESRAERARDGPKGAVSEYRPTRVRSGAAASPRRGQRRARLPAQTRPAVSFIEVRVALWCTAQGARVCRVPRPLGGAWTWPAEARLCRGVASGPVAASASPARGAGARPEAVATRGALVMCWERRGAACGGTQLP